MSSGLPCGYCKKSHISGYCSDFCVLKAAITYHKKDAIEELRRDFTFIGMIKNEIIL